MTNEERPKLEITLKSMNDTAGNPADDESVEEGRAPTPRERLSNMKTDHQGHTRRFNVTDLGRKTTRLNATLTSSTISGRLYWWSFS